MCKGAYPSGGAKEVEDNNRERQGTLKAPSMRNKLREDTGECRVGEERDFQ